MLHQSSLGAVYGVLKARPLWYRPDVSVLFIISAIAGGMSLTVFASMLSARVTKRVNVDDSILDRVAWIVGWILVGYLYFRFWDALAMTYTYEPGRTEGLRLLTSGPLSFNFWVGEILLGTIVPMVLLINKRTRSMPLWRMLALALVVGGVAAYRWDTNLSGLLIVLSYLPGEPAIGYARYVPSLVEFLSGAGVVAYGLLAFSLGVRYLKVINHQIVEEHAEEGREVTQPAAAD
jgi:Ni/Fe-hydrogenase subunit HybB-like protein